MPSNVRASVIWKNNSVFAGEDVECIITFVNVGRSASDMERYADYHSKPRMDTLGTMLERQRNVTQSTTLTRQSLPRRSSIASNSTLRTARGHRHTISMGVQPNTPLARRSSLRDGSTIGQERPHRRSFSIRSAGSAGTGTTNDGKNLPDTPTKRGRNHTRSISIQTFGQGAKGGEELSTIDDVNTPMGTPDLRADEKQLISSQARRNNNITGEETKKLKQADPSTPELQDSADPESQDLSSLASPGSPRTLQGFKLPTKPLPKNNKRRLSRYSVGSEATVSATGDSIEQHTHVEHDRRRESLISNRRRSSQITNDQPAHLMIGYAQITGSFTLDGSLVDQTPFEEVKRKGIMNSQAGGGVVGIEKQKPEGGLFGLGWGSIGDSLTGLLGMDDKSSIRQMRSAVNTKSIPLLHTPQSILFVDLNLSPGETRSYTYRSKLPKGLPPSYKGRAIKINYNLQITLQKSSSSEKQDISHVEVPFRTQGSVDRAGEILGHDLMTPYVLLTDKAETLPITSSAVNTWFSHSTKRRLSDTNMDDFLRYTERLIAERSADGALISPTATTDGRRFSSGIPEPGTMKEKIDAAILRANQASDHSSQSNNVFTIARAGQHVCVLTILRPAYRLGETVLLNADFTPQKNEEEISTVDRLKVYTITTSLESFEKIDPSFALRSIASTQRATRKVYAEATQSVFFANKASFGLEIPKNATPEFETTAVKLCWRVKVEFTTALAQSPVKQDEEDSGDIDEEETQGRLGITNNETAQGLGIVNDDDALVEKSHKSSRRSSYDSTQDAHIPAKDEEWLTANDMLESMSFDNRGRTLVAKERLDAEIFEISLPIRVYGIDDAASFNSSANTGEVLEL